MTVHRARRRILPWALTLLIAACTAQHDDLSTQTAPAAAADLVTVGHAPPAPPATSPLQAVGLAATSLPTSSALAGPHYAVALSAVAVATELTAAQLSELAIPVPGTAGLHAAAGSELLVVHVDDQVPPVTLLPMVGAAPVATVVVAGQSRPLGAVPAADSVLVVNAPVGAAVSLTIRDANQLQSIDLRSGRPSGERPLFLPQYTGVAQLLDRVHVDGVDASRHSQPITVVLTATLRPYVNKGGWAPAGKVWLDVDAVLSVPTPISVSLNLASSLTLRAPDGSVLHLPPDAVLRASSDPDASGSRTAHWTGPVAVPAGLRSLRIGFAVTGTVTRAGSATPLTYGHIQQHSDTPLQLAPRTG